jgi:hypothetical protein
MRDLTEDEIEEYFRYASADTLARDFHVQQVQLIGAAVIESGLFNAIAPKVLTGMADGRSTEEIILALWVSAFQMGRECESRLITLALQDARRPNRGQAGKAT